MRQRQYLIRLIYPEDPAEGAKFPAILLVVGGPGTGGEHGLDPDEVAAEVLELEIMAVRT